MKMLHGPRARHRAYALYIRVAAGLALAAAIPCAAYAQTCPPPLPATMNLNAELASTVASASVGFHALIQNQSSAFLGGQLAVNVVNKESGMSVDRFILPQQVGVLSQSGANIGFVWKVPGALPSGVYTLTATLIGSTTPFADVFSGALQPSASADITVKEGVPQPSLASVQVNGRPYTAHAPVLISASSAQIIAATFNGTAGPYKGTLTWSLYPAGAKPGDVPLDTKTQVVELHPGTKTEATYQLTDTAHDGYYLEGKLSDGRSASYIDVLLARNNTIFTELQCASVRAGGASGIVRGALGLAAALALLALAAALGYALHRRRS